MNSHLWSHSMLFWGRFGKILEFVGVLTTVVELIKHPLQEFRVWARKRLLREAGKLADHWQHMPQIIPKVSEDTLETTALYHRIRWGGKYTKEQASEQLGKKIGNPDPDTNPGCLATLIGIAGWFYVVANGLDWLARLHLPDWALAIIIVPCFIIALIAVVTGFIYALADLVIDVVKALLAKFILRPITIILRDGDEVGHGILWTGIILTIVGFHFDLLAT